MSACARLLAIVVSLVLVLVVGACSAAAISGSSASPATPTTTAGPGSAPPASASLMRTAPSQPAYGSPWPASPEPLPPATSGTPQTVTCGGRPFPRSGLDAPTGAQRAVGPEFDALRATLAALGPNFPGSADWPWRLAGEDATGAVFLARADALGPPGWVAVEVSRGTSGWRAGSMGQCTPRVVIADGYAPAAWALDPAYAAPGPTSTELYVLVWELACASGRPASGRMSAPVVGYGSTSVTITIGVRPLDGIQTCPGTRGTPALIRLPEPLGPRTLLDGDQVPPVRPTPLF